MDNVIFIPYQNKINLIYSLNAGDVHWCVNAKGIKGVSCPSKAYGIMSVAKPIIGVLEEGKRFVDLLKNAIAVSAVNQVTTLRWRILFAGILRTPALVKWKKWAGTEESIWRRT